MSKEEAFAHPDPPAAGVEASRRRKVVRSLKLSSKELRTGHLPLRIGMGIVRTGPLLMLAAIFVTAALTVPVFLTTTNLTNLGFQASIVICLALGQLVVMVTRGIDLSVGSVVALSGVTGSLVADGSLSGGLPVVATIVLTGAAVGLVNGVVFVKGRIPHPFVVTLATFTIARGIALLLANGDPNTGMPHLVQELGAGTVGGFPIPMILVAVLAAITFVLLQRTQWGRWIYAIGASAEAARRTGIPVGRLLISAYVVCGVAAGFCGLIVAGRTNAGSPTAGNLYELDAIAAVIIGGASFAGGRGTVMNAVVGALMISVIRNSMDLMSIQAFWQLVVIGVIIVIAVEFDVLRGYLEDRTRVLRARGTL
ncbi:MAG TPA: ABC transporter permease [Solirubrobacterales bacterium]|nr:ABC transporter permease [Solirubrobacterales bacterium]